MAAFIPIFIIEKVGRRPLMLFGVCHSLHPRFDIPSANQELLGRRHVTFNGRPSRNQLPPDRFKR